MRMKIEKEICDFITTLYEKYVLPKYDISDEELNNFFNVVYDSLNEKNKAYDYEVALHLIIMRAAFIASFSDQETFNINHLREGIVDLSCLGIGNSEIKKMQSAIGKNNEKKKNLKKKQIV